MGAGQELFEGYYDNTDIYFNLAELDPAWNKKHTPE